MSEVEGLEDVEVDAIASEEGSPVCCISKVS